MKLKRMSRKLLSASLAFLMMFSLFSLWPVQTWAATADEHILSGYQISNDYLTATLSGSNFALYTTGGDPANARDDDSRLLYGSLGNGTSAAVININSNTQHFYPETVRLTEDRTSLYACDDIGNVRVELFMSFSYNTYTGRYDTLEYKYIMTNLSAETQDVGARLFFDTMLGSNDHAPFRIAGQNITNGTTLTGDDIPQVWQVFDSYNDPSVVASGTFYHDINERPDRVQFLSYSNGYGTQWDCYAGGSIGDSAVNVYFDPITLNPGESRTVKTHYGLSQFIPNPDDGEGEDPSDPNPSVNMNLNVIVPGELLTNEDCTDYLGNPFTFNGWLSNTGNMTATNVTATLNLPEGLYAEEREIYIGDLASGADVNTAWLITAEPSYEYKYLEYSVTVSADGEEDRVFNYSINVPALEMPVHGHEYVETILPPTCTENGMIQYACACGDVFYMESGEPKLNHMLDNWVIDREATCTEAGLKHADCLRCGEVVENYYIPATGHNYTSEVTREATCTTPGIIKHTCTCGDFYTTYIYAEHNFEMTEEVAATCEQGGRKVYTCTLCSDTYEEIIPGGHDYSAEITIPATSDNEGLTTYTCSKCGDSYTETIPMRQSANVLLVQDRFPWSEDINATMLDHLLEEGYISGWDMATSDTLASLDLYAYDIIYIANDQSYSTYSNLESCNGALETFVSDGGVLIYGACDNGWASGSISYPLPGGVVKGNYYSSYNYIANPTHPVVLGTLTDGKQLTNEILYSTYCSHTYFDAATLPEGANTILTDASGRATLVEYELGEGVVIVSGLTWEYSYVRNIINGTSYAKNVYDDLIVYATYLGKRCDHAFDEGVTVAPTCTERGYVLHTCETCGATMKDQYTSPIGHVEGDWVIIEYPTGNTAGLNIKPCVHCGETLDREFVAPTDGATVHVVAPLESIIIGDTFEVLLRVENCDTIKAMAIVPEFDSDVFELVSAEWLVAAELQSIEVGSNRAVSAWLSYTDVNCNVYRIVLRAVSLAENTDLNALVRIQRGYGNEDLAVMAANVDVIECPHISGTITDIDDDCHARTCDRCGYTEVRDHSYETGCDTLCDDCGHTREPQHTPDETWTTDEHGHWKRCVHCGEVLAYSEHIYDNAFDSNCNECDHHRALYGDVNGDDLVNEDDAIFLLMHVFFPEEYITDVDCDYNEDGEVNSDDAIFLNQYIQSEEEAV